MKKRLVSIVMPTCNRKERLLASIQQIANTTPGYSVEIICVVDVDTATRDALSDLTIKRKGLGKVTVKCLFDDKYNGIPKSFNRGLAESQGEFIVFATDDLWFEDRWLTEAMKVMRQFPDGVGLVGFNDTHFGQHDVATGFIVHRQCVVENLGGCIAYEHYKYCCNDAEACDRARFADRYLWAERAVVRHDHPTYGTRPQDQNDLRQLPHINDDMDLFWKRRAAHHPNDFTPTITAESLATY